MNSGLNGLPSHFSKTHNLVGQTLNLGSQDVETATISFGPVKTAGVGAQNYKVAYGTTTLLDYGVRASSVTSVGINAKVTLDDFGNMVLTAGTIRCTAGWATQNNNPFNIRQVALGVYGWSPSSNELVSSDTGISKVATLVAAIGNGTTGDKTGWLQWGGQARVSSQFNKASDTTLANITGLTVTLAAGRTYSFRVYLHVSPDAVGGHQYAMRGTCTATSVIYQINTVNNTTNASVINSRQTALGGAAGVVSGTVDYTEIIGMITVNAGGTLTAQFAQQAASGTSSVLVGSFMEVNDAP